MYHYWFFILIISVDTSRVHHTEGNKSKWCRYWQFLHQLWTWSKWCILCKYSLPFPWLAFWKKVKNIYFMLRNIAKINYLWVEKNVWNQKYKLNNWQKHNWLIWRFVTETKKQQAPQAILGQAWDSGKIWKYAYKKLPWYLTSPF